jgi:hypothetical protein
MSDKGGTYCSWCREWISDFDIENRIPCHGCHDQWRPIDALLFLLLLGVFTAWFYFIGEAFKP